MKKTILNYFIISTILFGCNNPQPNKFTDNETGNEDTTLFMDIDALNDLYSIHASSKIIESVSSSIHSPLEFADDLIKSGATYSEKIPANILEKEYTSNETRSILAGIYAADICYIYMYNRKDILSEYYHQFLSLSKSLEFLDYLDDDLFKNLNNSNNSEELNEIIHLEFSRIHKKLEKEGRSNISTLMLIGSWIESTHIYFETYEQNQNTQIHDIIGKQKIVVNKLAILLSKYSNNPAIGILREDLSLLMDKFSVVKIQYTHGTISEINSKQDFLEIEDKSRKISVTDEEIEEIRIALESLRNKLVEG